MRNVIAVAPGLVDTEMTRGAKGEQCEPIGQRNALKRLVEVEDRRRFCWEMRAESRRSNDF